MDFEEEYWSKNYSEPKEMDGIGNAKEHGSYLKAVFNLEGVEINSMIDFGFGLGHLFKQFIKDFGPYRVQGIEPSVYAFSRFKYKKNESTKVTLKNIDLKSWCCMQKENSRYFDLGICTSVFQYLKDEEIQKIVPIIAQKVKYLYFTVPTDVELDRQISEMEFHDTKALRRSQDFYYKILSKDFSFVTSRLLESKYFFDDKTTVFTDLLFRF